MNRVLSLNRVTGPAAEPIDVERAKQHLRIDHDHEDEYIGGLITAARAHAETYRSEIFVTQKFELILDRFPPGREDITIPYHPLVSVASVVYVATDGTSTTFSTSKYTVANKHKPGIVALAADEQWPTTQHVVDAVTITFIAGHATPCSVSVSGDPLTPTGRSFTAAEVGRLSVRGGSDRTLPTPFKVLTDYFISAPNGTVQLAATSGGSAITIAAAGAGQVFIGEIPEHVAQGMLIMIAHWYENREPNIIGTNIMPIPKSADYLLDVGKVFQVA